MTLLLEAIASHSEKVFEIEPMDRIERNDTIKGLLAEFRSTDSALASTPWDRFERATAFSRADFAARPAP